MVYLRKAFTYYPSLIFLYLVSFFLLTIFLFFGCARDPGVMMQHSQTGQRVQCGPYAAVTWAQTMAAVERERGCVADYQRQGYERSP